MQALRVTAVLGVLLFWVGVFGAGALVDGYSAREDYISSLASRGSPVAVLGICALLASAAAHLATSRAVWGAGRQPWCAFFIFAAAAATTSVAAFRASCPDGPAGCAQTDAAASDQTNTAASDWVDVVHGVSVGGYELFTLTAMLTVAMGALRRPATAPRWLGLVSLALAIGSVLLLGQTSGDHVGMWQRLWIANNQSWLLVVAWVATMRHPAVE